MATITTAKATYRIRGPYTAKALRQLHRAFEEKYGVTDFDTWLRERGKVYHKIPKAS